MAQYYFHVEGDSNPDTEGTEIATLAEAKCAAARFAGRTLCDDAADFWQPGRADWKLTVADGNGLALFALTMVGIDAPTTLRAFPASG